MEDVHLPLRSVSLPSRLSSSDSFTIVSEFKNLRTSASVATPCSTMIKFNLRKLAEMYEHVGQLVLSSSGGNGNTSIEEVVDDSVLLLDVCGYAREMISSTKQEVQDLQSVLRRKSRSSCGEVARQAKSFTCFRKNTRRAISKHLDLLGRLEREYSIVNTRFVKIQDQHSFRIREELRELSGLTVWILRSLLTFFCPPPKTVGSGLGWSFVSRLVLSTEKRKQGNETKFNGLESVDSDVFSLMKGQAVVSEDVTRVQTGLENLLVGCIDGFEERLDCLHKLLIRNRICLLNALTPLTIPHQL